MSKDLDTPVKIRIRYRPLWRWWAHRFAYWRGDLGEALTHLQALHIEESTNGGPWTAIERLHED